MEKKLNAQKPNLEKLAVYINQQPNPKEFAALLLAIAALKPRSEHSADCHEEMEVVF